MGAESWATGVEGRSNRWSKMAWLGRPSQVADQAVNVSTVSDYVSSAPG